MNRESCHVFVVDDDPDLAELISESIEEEKFTVTTCHSAGEALEKMAGQKFDVVVSDAHMPGMQGLEFLEQLRKEYTHPFLFYLCTGDIDITIEEIRSRGGQGLIPKPYNLSELVDMIVKDLKDCGKLSD